MANCDAEPLPKIQAQSESQFEHNQLVSYIHAISGVPDGRQGIWLEHSYARRGVSHGALHILLAPQTDATSKTEIDVEAVSPEPILPDLDTIEDYDDEDVQLESDQDAEDWESKAKLLAPTKTHAQLISSIAEIMRDLRLQQLMGVSRHEVMRYFARRLRRKLAPLWAWTGPPAQRPAAWAHSTLLAYMPRSERMAYIKLVDEIRKSAPRLAERLGAGYTCGSVPAVAISDRISADAPGPWLVLIRSPCPRQDARWERALCALLHVRLAPEAPYPVHAAPPEKWCAEVAASAHNALANALADAGERTVVVVGCGAGSALAASAAIAAPGARALALLAPPLVTAEGTSDSPEDAMRCSGLPTLIVCPASMRSLALAVGARRTVLVTGADPALRLPPALRRRWRIPERAVDAVVAEECRQWAVDVAEEEPSEAPSPAPPGLTSLSPHTDDFSHLPQLPNSRNTGSARQIEIVDGRVVSRVSGATPLALLPPRRSVPSAPAPAAPSIDDIMHMPIVFADDEPDKVDDVNDDGVGGSRYSRVIVAKRGRGRGRPRGSGVRHHRHTRY